ncbi:hypothetical protein D3C75_781790 [compost metagenome]
MELLSSRVHEDGAVLDLDLLQGLEAIRREGRADHIEPLDPLFRQLGYGDVGIGLEPLLLAEAGLEAGAPLLGGQTQRLRQQGGGAATLMTVRVPLVLAALGNAVEGHQQVLTLSLLLPLAAHAHGQRLNVFRVVVIVADEAHHRQVALLLHHPGPAVEHGGRGAGGILRVERQQYHPVDPLGLERLPALVEGGRAIGHGQHHGHIDPFPLELLLQRRPLPLADGHQG